MARSALTSTLFGTIKWTLAGVVMIVILAGIGNRLIGLQTSTEAARGAKSEKPKKTGDDEERTAENVTREDRALFFNLLDSKVLTPRADGGIDMKASDYILVMRAAEKDKGEGGIPLDTQARYLGMMYHKSVGTIIRQQVRLWNETRRIAGIRDNRPRSEGEEGKTQWRAFSSSDHPLRTGSLVPEAFGFVHGSDVSVGFSQWETVAAQKTNVTFRTRIKVSKPTVITIQVTGNVVKAPPGAKIIRKEDKPFERRTFWPCRIPVKAGSVQIRVVPSDRGVPVAVTVEPAVNCDPTVFGLAISMEVKDKDAYREKLAEYAKQRTKWRRTRKSRRGAEPVKPVAQWTYRFRPVERSKKTEKKFAVRTRDGVWLTDKGGKPEPTDDAFDLGLVSLVGFGPADANSLMGMLSRSKIPTTGLNLTLTIDSRIQRIAQKTMNHYLGTVFPKLSAKFADKRKSSLILVDADTGALIAYAGWPLPPKGATAWDYVSFATAQPNRDPMAIFAWEVVDQFSVPGSTLKPLVGLTIARLGQSRLRSIMLGLSPGELAAATNLNVGSGTYVIPGSGKNSISNFGKTALSSYFGSGLRAGRCKPQGITSNPGKFGLAEATKNSINMWFARLAVMIDEQTVEEFTQKLRADVKAKRAPKKIFTLARTRLMKSLETLGISDLKRIDLASNVPASLGLYRVNTARGADILYSQRALTHITTNVDFDTWNPSAVQELYTHRVGLNGIGQGWNVSVLHLVAGVSAIASGRAIKPYIIDKWGVMQLKAPEAKSLRVDPDILTALRVGMKAVPEVGTAAGQFARPALMVMGKTGRDLGPMKKRLAKIQATIGCRTYAKTGTADVFANAGYNTGNFVGWKDPVRPDGRRIAFACMTTHATGPFRFGGSSCGRIMRDILTSIEYINGGPAAAGSNNKKSEPRRRTRPNVRGPRVAPRLDGPRQQ